MNKAFSSEEEEGNFIWKIKINIFKLFIDYKNTEESDLSYLDILQRPSFREQQKNFENKDISKNLGKNPKGKDENKLLEYDYIEPKIEQYIKNPKQNKNDYDYPVNIFKKIFYIWALKALKASNTHSELEVSHLGKFSKELYPDNLLKEVKSQWEEISKNTKSSLIIKMLLKGNTKILLLIFLGSLFVSTLDSFNVILYNQIVNNIDNKDEEKTKSSLLINIILLLINYFIYMISFRSMESYTKIFSFKLIIQLDALLYDKLLNISPFNNISEGILVNFIQSDIENFAKIFAFTPAILVLPMKVLFFIYLLFSFYGITFIFSIICLCLFFFVFSKLQKLRVKYLKEIISKKDKRMKTTSKTFDMIKTIKLYSWEDYFLNKIRKEREEELLYFQKSQIVSLFIDSIRWSICPILNFVSILTYNLLNEPMEVTKLLTSLYIFHNLPDPLFLIPGYVNELNNSLIYLKRIEAFLFSKEYIPSQMIYKNKIIKNKNKKNDKIDKKNNENKSTNDNIPEEILDNLNISIEKSSNVITEKEKYEEKEIMINIDDINFGIIKKEEEFMIMDKDYENEEEIEINKNSKNKEEEDVELEVIDDIDKNNSSNINKKQKLLNEYKIEEKNKIKKKKYEKIKGVKIFPILKGIKLKIQKGDLIGIIGEIGSGKTSLFNAILNNLDILNGQNKKIIINGSIAYIPQRPWVLNDTIRNNIIFNRSFKEEKYNKIIKICHLLPDLKLLKQGDLTIISDKEDSLSEGQKIKINIARAIYSDADIYLFDEPFSSLDIYVGKIIFEKVIKEYLKGKTILIITHSFQYISFMDYVIKMKEGEIQYYGSIKEAEKQNFYSDFISSHQANIYEETLNNYYKKKKQKKPGVDSETDYTDSEELLLVTKSSRRNIDTAKKKYNFHNLSKFEILKIVFSYSGGWFIFICILFFNILWKFSESGSDIIITNWPNPEQIKDNNMFIEYIFLKLLSIIFIFVKRYIIVYALISFNRNIHETLIYRLLRGPINLFHNIVTKSHIINRLSKDIEKSVKYFWSINSSLSLLFHIINAIVISLFLFKKIIFLIPFLIFLKIILYNYYINCGKGLNALETYTSKPIISSVKETLSGITIIRAYGFKDTFQLLYHEKLHNFYKVLVYQVGGFSWFALNNNLISFCFLSFILLFIYLFKNIINVALLGIVLNHALILVEYSYYFFANFMKNEKMSISMESCDAYTHIVQEAPLKLKTDEMLIQNNFPKSGKIEFVNYSVRYRPDTKLALKDINILIQPGEKIGIVGRTGSGKSTLCLCLFRILEATTGQILIDDIDISLIGLSLLRSIITVIPQDPTLIEGTLGENLDPFGGFGEKEMTDALKTIGMEYILEENGLNFRIKENGNNLSAGERQLICMARALIRKSKIIIIDEATSNMDSKSEQLIQKAILTILKESTIITIAHRIKTILEYDRILVFEQGKLIEQGNPKELIDKKEGTFYYLYSQSCV